MFSSTNKALSKEKMTMTGRHKGNFTFIKPRPGLVFIIERKFYIFTVKIENE